MVLFLPCFPPGRLFIRSSFSRPCGKRGPVSYTDKAQPCQHLCINYRISPDLNHPAGRTAILSVYSLDRFEARVKSASAIDFTRARGIMITATVRWTSGGDAPGMNAAIRGVVRAQRDGALEVIKRRLRPFACGEDRMASFDRYSASGMINRGVLSVPPVSRNLYQNILRQFAIENLKVARIMRWQLLAA